MNHNQTSMQAVGLRVDYQPDVDLLFAWLGHPKPAENIEVESGVYVRIDPQTQQVVGIEVLDCAERYQMDPASVDATFAQQLIEVFTRPALERFAALRP